MFAKMFKCNLEVEGAKVEHVKGITTTLAQVHAKLGHSDIKKTWQTMEALKWKLSDGVMDSHASCMVGKAKQKNVTKHSSHKCATKPGQRSFQHFYDSWKGRCDMS